jgi:hypothetical protein
LIENKWSTDARPLARRKIEIHMTTKRQKEASFFGVFIDGLPRAKIITTC